jgi:cytochrome P450
MKRTLAEIDAIIYKIIGARRSGRESHGDLLGLLMAARDEDGRGLSDAELRDESITLMFAAHETTGTTITWALSLISKYPEAEKRMREEIARVSGDRAPSFADTMQLVYSKQVMEETMRLNPAGPIIPRELAEADHIGPYALPKGGILFVSPFVMHRDPRYWDNPEAFDPERFTKENVAKRHKFSYIPFILGPRQCIGNHFAMTEMLVAIPMILQRYRIALVPGMQPSTMHLRFNQGMWMTVKEKEAA